MSYHDNTEPKSMFKKIVGSMTNYNDISYEMRKRKKDVIMWLGFIVIVALCFICISSKEFSFFMVLSAMTQTFALFIIAQKVYNYQNSSGLSLNSMICYLILIGSRLSSTVFYSGYLPSDSAGDWFYQLCEVTSLILTVVIIIFITKLFKDTAEGENEDQVDYKYLVVPALILALLVHTGLNNNLLTDIAWSFSMYLESVSIFPQLFLFMKKKGQIESYTSHYVSLQGISRFFSLVFWFYTYEELNEEMDDSISIFHSYTGYFLIASQLVQLIIMIEFYYYYIKSLLSGEKMQMTSDI